MQPLKHALGQDYWCKIIDGSNQSVGLLEYKVKMKHDDTETHNEGGEGERVGVPNLWGLVVLV